MYKTELLAQRTVLQMYATDFVCWFEYLGLMHWLVYDIQSCFMFSFWSVIIMYLYLLCGKWPVGFITSYFFLNNEGEFSIINVCVVVSVKFGLTLHVMNVNIA